MEFTELMKGFATKVGMTGLQLAEDGVCRVEIDGMAISFVEVPETRQLVTWAEVGEPPPEGRERLYRVLMESMYMGKATGGSTFSIDSESGLVYLFRLDPLPLLDLDTFMLMLEKFVNVLEEWRKIVADYREVASDLEKTAAEADEQVRQMGMGANGFMQV